MSGESIMEKLKDAQQRHRERHSATGLDFAFADRLDLLHAPTWDRLVSDQSVFLQRDYLLMLDRHRPENLRSRYVLVTAEGCGLAAMALQVLDLNAASLQPIDEETGLKSRSLERIQRRVLICGNCLSWGLHGVAFAPDMDDELGWRAVAEALYRVRRAEKLNGQVSFVMVKDLPGAGRGDQVLERISYRPVETEPDMELTLSPDWTSHDDYLGALTSKYRKAVRKIYREIEDAGCEVIRVTDVHEHADRLHDLYLQVHRHAGLRLIEIHPGYLPALVGLLGDAIRCALIRRGEDVLGFVLTIRDGETAIGYYLGYDTGLAADLPLYLRLLHAVIEDAIDLECSRLSFGRTALEPKARLGATPVPMRVWQRHRNPLVNAITRRIVQAVSHDEPPERSPFK